MSVGQRGLEAAELAAERAVDDHVAGVDHRAADQALVDGGLDFHVAAEALAQRSLERVEFACGQRRCASASAARSMSKPPSMKA